MKYGRTAITLDKVVSALRSRGLEIKTGKNTSSNGENYYVKRQVKSKKYEQ